MKTMVLITRTEGGCDREDITQEDINKIKKETFQHPYNCTCYSCTKVKTFESMKVGKEIDGDPLGVSWIFMTSN